MSIHRITSVSGKTTNMGIIKWAEKAIALDPDTELPSRTALNKAHETVIVEVLQVKNFTR